MTPIPPPKRIRQTAPTIHTIRHRQSIQLRPSTFSSTTTLAGAHHAKRKGKSGCRRRRTSRSGRRPLHNDNLDGHFAPGIECGAIGARPYLRLIKPAPSAQSAAVITAATAMSVKNASEAKIRSFILAGPHDAAVRA